MQSRAIASGIAGSNCGRGACKPSLLPPSVSGAVLALAIAFGWPEPAADPHGGQVQERPGLQWNPARPVTFGWFGSAQICN